jgi:hypothetical protein
MGDGFWCDREANSGKILMTELIGQAQSYDVQKNNDDKKERG